MEIVLLISNKKIFNEIIQVFKLYKLSLSAQSKKKRIQQKTTSTSQIYAIVINN